MDDNETHFLFLHYFVGSHCSVMCIWKREKMLRKSVCKCCIEVAHMGNESEVKKDGVI